MTQGTNRSALVADHGRESVERQPASVGVANTCYVFFVTYRKRRITWRAIRKFKGLAYRSFIIWLIATLGRCELVHVCIADNRVVLDQTLFGPKYYDTLAFCLKYPRLAWCFEFKTPAPINVELAADLGPVKCLRTIIRRLTFGLVKSNDCVTSTCMVLRDAGMDVPKGIITPGHLWDYLRSQGHKQIEMD